MSAHRGADALRDFHRAFHGRVRKKRDEFIAGVPRGDIVATKISPEYLGDLDEDVVALKVTEGVVDQLEMVDVDHQQRQRLSGCARRLDRRRGGVDERAAQRQPR
jgi:hypothetical protein